MQKQIENAPESAIDRSPERSGADRRRIEDGRLETNERINAIVRTNTAEGDDKSKDKNNNDKKPDDNKNRTESDGSEGSNVRHNDATSGAPARPKESPYFAPASAVGLTAAGATMAAFSPSVISQIPLIGKIPYLPQAAAAFQSGIQSVLSPLGLGTGVNATHSIMYALPNWAGYAGVAGLAVPAGLWSLGMVKSLITGKRYGGLTGNIKEGARTIVGAPFYAYDQLMNARYKGGKLAQSTWNTATAPIKGTWNLGKNIVKGTWNGATQATSAALRPTWAGGAGLAGGTVLGVMGAPLTGGASLIASPLLGYAAGNMLKNSGSLEGKAATTASAH